MPFEPLFLYVGELVNNCQFCVSQVDYSDSDTKVLCITVQHYNTARHTITWISIFDCKYSLYKRCHLPYNMDPKDSVIMGLQCTCIRLHYLILKTSLPSIHSANQTLQKHLCILKDSIISTNLSHITGYELNYI